MILLAWSLKYQGCSNIKIRINIILVHCRPYGVLVYKTGSVRQFLGVGIVSTNSEEAFFSPVGSPRVPNDPILLAPASDAVVPVHCAVANQDYSVVDFSVSITAVQKVFCKYSSFVCSEHPCRVYRNWNGLVLEELSELLIVSAVVFHVSDILHVNCFVSSVFASVASFFPLAILIIVVFPQDSEFWNVLESLVHPAASASIIVSIAIQKLLNWVLLQLLIDSCDFSETLNCWSRGEGPATTTWSLIVRSCHISIFVPIFVWGQVILKSSYLSLNSWLVFIELFVIRLNLLSFDLLSSFLRNDDPGSIFGYEFVICEIGEFVNFKSESGIIHSVDTNNSVVVLLEYLEPLFKNLFWPVFLVFSVFRNKVQKLAIRVFRMILV